MPRLIASIVVACGLLVLVAYAKESKPATQPAIAPQIEVIIEQAQVKPDEHIAFKLKFTNRNDVPITIVQPIDGCDVGWRFVSYGWSGKDADGNDLQKRGMGRCGNTNPLQKADFITIEPGKSVEVSGGFLSGPNALLSMQAPGKYVVGLTYTCDRTKSDKGGLALGEDERGTDALVEQAWVGTVTAPPVEIEVVGK